MGWLLFLILVLAVAFGVAGAVIKVTAIILLSILAAIATLILLVVLTVRYGWWRATREMDRRLATRRRDDRY
jgi:hypothetical protein